MSGQDWHTQAACIKVGPAAMHPNTVGQSSAEGPVQRQRIDRAKAVCAACPVRAECLTHALTEGETDGIWGGLTPDERDVERRRRGIKRRTSPRLLAQCGTRGGYQRHRRNGEDPCDACRSASREATALRRAEWREGRAS